MHGGMSPMMSSWLPSSRRCPVLLRLGLPARLHGYLSDVGRDEGGAVKGDGLVTYLKAPSVDLAVQIIDGTPLRDGLQQTLSVSQARC